MREPLPFTGQAHQSPPGCPAQIDRWPEAAHERSGQEVGRGTKGCHRTSQTTAVCLGRAGGGHRRGRLPPAPARAPPRLVPTPEPHVPALSWDSGHKRLLGVLLLIQQSE